MNRIYRTVALYGLLLAALATSAFGQDDKQAANGKNQSARAKEDAVCTKCHDQDEKKPILAFYQSRHGVMGDARTPSCQSCHGQSDAHVKNPGGSSTSTRPTPDVLFAGKKKSDAEKQSGACISCHESGLRTHWRGSQHQANDVACSNCHTVHTPKDPMVTKTLQSAVCFTCHKEQRADTHKISTHPLDTGKMACSGCHNPHGSAGPKLLKKNTVTETCWTCHAEKRGPFLWEHQPVNEDCTHCHTPHGSNITPLLKSRAPFLCDECHDGPHNSQSPFGTAVGGIQARGVAPGGNPSTSAVGRACMNCHVMIHGSNSPAGAYLHR
jgi:DmsE family decaheme c-type cytochrome